MFGDDVLDLLGSLNSRNSFKSTIPLTGVLNNLLQQHLADKYTSENTPVHGLEDYLGEQRMPNSEITGLQQLKELAEQTWPGNPMMQQLAISQAIQESGLPGHMSGLATKSNNLFGIKGAGTNELTTEYYNGTPVTESADFAKNNSALESFLQHKNLLTKASRYAPVLGAESLPDAFNALQKAGYATDPNYSRNLNRIFNTYVKDLY